MPLTILIALVLGQDAGQPTWNMAVRMDLTRERAIGLLDLPDVTANGCGPREPKNADLYASPVPAQPAIGSIVYVVTERAPDGSSCGAAHLALHRRDRAEEEVPTDESDYEVKAVVVYERSGDWFRIALQHGSAWIHRTDPDDFHAYPEILEHSLAYIKQGWDGTLWAAPGGASATRVPAASAKYLDRDVDVTVLGIRRVGDEQWIHVRLDTETCGETLSGVTPVTGWIPAYRASGSTAAWFSTRGC